MRSRVWLTLAVPLRRTFATAPPGILPSSPLPYRGVRVDLTASDAPSFAERIGPSIQHWREDGRLSVMLSLPIDLAGVASIAAKVSSYLGSQLLPQGRDSPFH